MAATKIQWTGMTWNPFTGCTPVSIGCANCFALKNVKRMQNNPNITKYRNGFNFTVHTNEFQKPSEWKKPQLVFVNDMGDTFHEKASLDDVGKLFEVMKAHPQHIFQVLTKRSKILADMAPKLPWPENIWMGVTVEHRDCLMRLDHLRQVQAHVRFVSFEPLLSDLPNLNLDGIDWVIVGGESGPKARPMKLDWARQIRDQCRKEEIAFFFKQVGGSDKNKGGETLDGEEWKQFPSFDHEALRSYMRKLEDKSNNTEFRSSIVYFIRNSPHPEIDSASSPDEAKESATVSLTSEATASESPPSPMEVSDEEVSIISQDLFCRRIESLFDLESIVDDKGKEIAFEGQVKREFLSDVEQAYVTMRTMVQAVYDMGELLYQVRKRQKKRRLWMRFQEEIGLTKSAANNYIRVYERFGESLREYQHLGISKLELLSSMEQPVEYLQANSETVAKSSVRDIRNVVAEAKSKGNRKPRDRKTDYEEEKIGDCTVKISSNGSFLQIVGLNKEKQQAILDHLKSLLSPEN